MFKLTAIYATIWLISLANAGLVTNHHVIHESVLAKVGHIVHSAPSAVSHQSITHVHGKTHIVEPVLAPVLRTVHSPVVHTYHAAPVVHSIPLVHSAPIVSVHHQHH